MLTLTEIRPRGTPLVGDSNARLGGGDATAVWGSPRTPKGAEPMVVNVSEQSWVSDEEFQRVSHPVPAL